MPARPPRTLLLAGIAVAVRAVGSLLLNKLVAVLAPAGGLTALAQFQNLLALLTALPNDGTHVGLTKYLAPLRPGSPRYRAWLGAAAVLNAAALAAGAVVLLLTGRAGFSWLELSVLLLGLALLVAQPLLSTSLLAAGRLLAYAAATAALAALGLAGATAALALGWPLAHVWLAYLMSQGMSVLPALMLARRAGLLRPWPALALPGRAAVRGLLAFGLMGASTLLFGRAVDYAVRAHLLAAYGPVRTDLWQAVSKLSDNYTMVFGAVAASVFFPRLAALAPRPAEARAYVRAALAWLAPALALGLSLLYLSRHWLLPLLFNARLAAAAPLLAPQLLADWAKFLSWLLIYQLIARAQTGRYVAVQAVSAVLYVALLAALLPRLGLAGAVWAQAARYGLVLLVGAGLMLRRG